MNSRTRDGKLVSVYDGQGGILRFLYEKPLGQQLLKLLIRPGFSKAAGWLLSAGISRPAIGPFVRKNGIDLTEYIPQRYASFDAFFSRKIRPEARTVDMEEDHLIAPADGKLTVVELEKTGIFQVKGVRYTLESLLRDETLAERYQGGTLLIFRLSVDDYHRYCHIASGFLSETVKIPGVYHTVSPQGTEHVPVYRENTREYALLATEAFGMVLVMEVGALLVGRIVNHPGNRQVLRGEEKGYFRFGGSSVLVLLEPGCADLDADILQNSAAGEETIVKMGERIGTRKSEKCGGAAV